MPKGKPKMMPDSPEDLCQACPKGRMRVHPVAVSAFRAWLTLIARRHGKARAAAVTARAGGVHKAFDGIIQQETAAIKLIGELFASLSDKFDRVDWHAAVAEMWDVMNALGDDSNVAT